jgi:prepilin-type N-terminal cleavage/methylation domain-containing protein
MRPPSATQKIRGFSLVELMVGLIVVSVLTVMAVPVFSTILRNLRADGDMRSLHGDITLAKMRAAASFSKARLRADLTARTFQVELWNKSTNTWSVEGGTQSLSKGINYGYSSLSSPPASTQASIGQAPQCQTDAQTVSSTTGTVANTACIVFSSRGIPIDATGSPTTADAIYINNGASVQAITINATGLIRAWRTDVNAANWKKI